MQLVKAQQTQTKLKERLAKKSKKLKEAKEELDRCKSTGKFNDDRKLASQVEFLKDKLAKAEKKNLELEVELLSTKGDVAKLHEAVHLSTQIIQTLQQELHRQSGSD